MKKLSFVLILGLCVFSLSPIYAIDILSSLKHATQVIGQIFVTDDGAQPKSDKSNVNVQVNSGGIFVKQGKKVGIGTFNPLAPLHVVGETKTDNLSVSNLIETKDLHSTNNTTIDNLVTTKNLKVNNNANITNTTTTKDLTVSNQITTQNLTANGTTTLKNTTINGTLINNGNTNINGNATISNTTTTKDLKVSNNADITNTTTTKDLVANGNTTLKNTIINGTLTNNGNTNINGNATISNTTTTKDLKISNNADINNLKATSGTINTLNTTNINNSEKITTKDLQVNKTFIVGGDFSVQGTTTLNGDTKINGDLYYKNATNGQTFRQLNGKIIPSSILQNLGNRILVKNVPLEVKYGNYSNFFVDTNGNTNIRGNTTIGGNLNIGIGKLKDSTIVSADIKDGEVKTNDIANSAITNPKLATNSITSDKIKDGEVKTNDIANGAVNSLKITDNTITDADIKDNSITASSLAPNSVGNSELQDDITVNTLNATTSIETPKLITDHLVRKTVTNIGVKGDILPEDTTYRNIGSSTNKWKNIFVSDKVNIGNTDLISLSNGQLKINNSNGYLAIGPANTSRSHFVTDRPRYYFNKEIQVDGGKIGSYNSNLNLTTNGTTRIFVNKDNGNVGIGTISPNVKLDVNGDTNLSGDVNINGNTNIDKNLQVNQGLLVNGNTRVQDIEINKNAYINQNAYVNQNLNINGITKLNNQLTIDFSSGSTSYPKRITTNTKGGAATIELQTYNSNLHRLSTRLLLRGAGSHGIELYDKDENLFVRFDGSTQLTSITGKLQLNNGQTISKIDTDTTLSDNSNYNIPTQKAVKTYVDNKTSFKEGYYYINWNGWKAYYTTNGLAYYYSGMKVGPWLYCSLNATEYNVAPYWGKCMVYKSSQPGYWILEKKTNDTEKDVSCTMECFGLGTNQNRGSYRTDLTHTNTYCGTDKYLNGNQCVDVGVGHYSPNNNNNREDCTGLPLNAHWTSAGGGADKCGRACDKGFTEQKGICKPIHI